MNAPTRRFLLALLILSLLAIGALSLRARIGSANLPSDLLAANSSSAPAFNLSLSISPPTFVPGSSASNGTIAYKITATNNTPPGAKSAAGVVLRFSLSPGLSLDTANSTATCKIAGGAGLCSSNDPSLPYFLLTTSSPKSFDLSFSQGVLPCGSSITMSAELTEPTGTTALATANDSTPIPCDSSSSSSSNINVSSAFFSSMETTPQAPALPFSIPNDCPPAVTHTQQPSCIDFCDATTGQNCKNICTYLQDSTPPISDYLCPGKSVVALTCNVLPETPRQVHFPRVTCTYGCGKLGAASSSLPCIREGGLVSTTVNACCPGLKRVPNAYFDKLKAECTTNDTQHSICTNCGDGLCGQGENACNCTQDCGGNAQSSASSQ